MSFLTNINNKIFNKESPLLKEGKELVLKINELESGIKDIKDEDLPLKTAELKERISKGETLDDILPEAFALVREAAKRTLGQRHYDVQLLGGFVMHRGSIAEMKTGEGKTLVATLPAYLNALSGKGVHIVTVNDYLSRRDAVWMGQIYYALGLSVGCINHESSFLYDPTHEKNDLDKERDERGSFQVVHEFLRPCSRRESYYADITYGTNNEFGFDYLRDNIVYNENELSQRDYNYAIIDEIDSILIDEARTPLIISAPSVESEDLYKTFAKIAEKMDKETDYEVDEKLRAISLTENGIDKAEKILGIGNIYTEKGIKYVHHLETAIRAKALFERDKDYVVKNDEVIIVDEFTGRLQPGRRWSEGLHQAVEAKEGVSVQKESRTFASVTFQNYFRMYEKLSGMTGTALTSAEEFHKVYNLDVASIPTNKPLLRKDKEDYIFQTSEGRFKAVAQKVKELHDKGQPVLVGTVSIERNEYLSLLLKKEGVQHEVLNAKNHEKEGEIIAQAGKLGRVTIATNMAGRGVDVVLGGNPKDEEEQEKVKELGGLYVVGTGRHEARRIDNQLRGRSGRQGDPGETRFFVSLEDDLMRVFGSDRIKSMMGRFGIPEDEPIENKLVTKSLEAAQTKIEGMNFDARKHILEYDDVLNKQRKTVYSRRRTALLGDHNSLWTNIETIYKDYDEPFDAVQKKREEMGDNLFFRSLRMTILQNIDMLWLEHLEAMDYVRSSVRLRAFGQRDPLIEYKNEGLRLFHELEEAIDSNLIKLVPHMGGGVFMEEKKKLEEVHKSGVLTGGNNNGDNTTKTIVNKNDKVGRNDPCPCGAKKVDNSPIKYKHCHGQ
ncbi:MAG: preprotein translocase subunit SecA [Parcubacteria group bacterium CG10_big_fil_rev_8_21_14_0_10_38_31]|nr:MAG: preprotein translocase subunit SecA [Parcubacteria group bacterium CG10_big_fil_rev_8_21_14_0_10_38_31]